MYQQENNQEIWARIVAKCWSDKSYRENLLKNSVAVLEEEGYTFRDKNDNYKIVLVEDTPDTKHWVIPITPANLPSDPGDILTLAAQRLEEQHELF
jgi:hypothetical protein